MAKRSARATKKAPKSIVKSAAKKPVAQPSQVEEPAAEPIIGFLVPPGLSVAVWDGEAPAELPIERDLVLLRGMTDVQNVKVLLSAAREALRDGGTLLVSGSGLSRGRRRLTRGHLSRWFSWTGFKMTRFSYSVKQGGVTYPLGANDGDVFATGEKCES